MKLFNRKIRNYFVVIMCSTTPFYTMANDNPVAVTQSQSTEAKSRKLPAIDILYRIYKSEEISERFLRNEIRTTDEFRKCKVMVKGQIEKIGTSLFTPAPQIQITVPGATHNLHFNFENSSYNREEVAKFEPGDTIILSGANARMGTFGGIFFDDTSIMNSMVSKKTNRMLVLNGGIYDRSICDK
ncbi:hypothetical protein [Lelliottia sp. T2.26D-8]|uniref:hypothetical protein n=1 Tax=Lelliottia sp. T2.26D-8 TaxID=3041165 RepID=UPI002477ADE0|nr:hypothetical protein [Lelliottia sp. T2.26D-8]CAI9411089.1 hypothetical protein CCAJJPOJ_01694 [Lelliottia sp. T2.26D-8]